MGLDERAVPRGVQLRGPSARVGTDGRATRAVTTVIRARDGRVVSTRSVRSTEARFDSGCVSGEAEDSHLRCDRGGTPRLRAMSHGAIFGLPRVSVRHRSDRTIVDFEAPARRVGPAHPPHLEAAVLPERARERGMLEDGLTAWTQETCAHEVAEEPPLRARAPRKHERPG